MAYHRLEMLSNMHDGYKKPFVIGGVELLLVQCGEKRYLVENKCGHFGVPLETAELTRTSIICSAHGVEFDLASGNVLNDIWPDCEPVKVFPLVENGAEIGVEL